MKLFSEKVEPTFTNSTFNVLQTENFSEIFFDVYEIELNKIKYPAEKVSSFRGNPVVSVPVVIGEKEQEFPFVLIKGNESIFFNESNIEVPIDDTPVEVEDTDVLFESVDIDHDHRIKEDTKREIMEHIENAKVNARKQAESIKREKLKEADTEIRKKNKLLRESLNTAKQQLVNEFISITKSIKRELINEADDKYSELTLTIDNKINDLANTLAESIQSDFENSSQELETNIRAFVKAIHNESVLPELRKSLETIATDAVVRIKGIESDLDKKLTEKVDVSVIQELTSELDALRNTNVELNNSLNKGVNKALSRVGNVSTRLDEAVADITKQVDDKISATADNISSYYSDKLQVLEDQTFELNEKSRKYVVDIVRESRDNLISEIRKIQKEAPVEFVIESAGKKKTKSFDSIQKDIDKKISDRVSDEVVKLRKYIAVYSGGGGTVAQQFAEGGTMNGNLTVVGTISASQYLGIPGGGGVSGDYLPLSGGTINGNLTVNGRLSADTTSTELTNTIKGNTDILGTGSNRLLIDYDSTATINADSGVSIQASNGTVSLSGSQGVSINGGGAGVNISSNLTANGLVTVLSGANITGNTTITGDLTASGMVTSPDFSVTGTSGGELTFTKDVRTWAIGTKTYDVDPPESVPRGLDFKPDGMMFYIIGTGTSRPVYAFALDTAWDINTVTGNVSQSIGAFDNGCQEIVFSNGDGTNDGKYMYILGDTGNRIGRWTLGTPWNINSVSSTSPDTGQNLVLTSLAAGFTINTPQGVFFSPDGKKMFICDGTSNSSRLFQFDLNVPWSLASGNVTYTSGNTLSVNAQESLAGAIVLNSNGTRLFITGLSSDRIHEYSLPTPYSLVGAIYVGRSATVMGAELEPCGLYYNDIFNKCFIVGSNQDFVREVDVTPQPLLKGTRPLILANPTSVDDRVTMNSLQITDTTVSTSNTAGALIVAGGIGVSGGITAVGSIAQFGNVNINPIAAGVLSWNGSTSLAAPVNGTLILRANTVPFNIIQINGTTATDAGIKRNGTGIDIVRADQTTSGSTPLSGFTDLRARNITAFGPIIFQNTTVTGAAPLSGASFIGAMLYISDEAGGPTMAFYDGTNWRRVQDRAIIAPIP